MWPLADVHKPIPRPGCPFLRIGLLDGFRWVAEPGAAKKLIVSIMEKTKEDGIDTHAVSVRKIGDDSFGRVIQFGGDDHHIVIGVHWIWYRGPKSFLVHRGKGLFSVAFCNLVEFAVTKPSNPSRIFQRLGNRFTRSAPSF